MGDNCLLLISKWEHKVIFSILTYCLLNSLKHFYILFIYLAQSNDILFRFIFREMVFLGVGNGFWEWEMDFGNGK